ncbi:MULTISPECIES: accessory factor UbiK family protein [Bombella]|uniref:Accessory factor UbiK family protein n=1 Tax=Bombella pollinis TaxID=2967337 RepID=A0ABT3WMW9_9PROT|nr:MULTISPECIES: accessory factor UbiK family protein [Bombella]MCX5619184.1 accessory factor UbiK family protein [Bombella pollinis]MUG05544.1 accessory factor UbiK family protein [Bombella sp. ESL0378]MUG89293.1 accessory factor UbiK family protein [Bombella sp. ESL0385]
MAIRPRFFDDIAGFAGTAFSAATGVREEIHTLIRSQINEILFSLHLVRRDEFEAVQEMASHARLAQEKAEHRLAALEARLDELEQSLTAPSSQR